MKYSKTDKIMARHPWPDPSSAQFLFEKKKQQQQQLDYCKAGLRKYGPVKP